MDEEKRTPLLPGSPRGNPHEARLVSYVSGRRRFPFLVFCLSAIVVCFLYTNLDSSPHAVATPYQDTLYYGPPDPPEALDDNLREEILRYGDAVPWDSTQHGGGDHRGHAGDGTTPGGEGDIEGGNDHFVKIPTTTLHTTSTSVLAKQLPTRPATPFNVRPKIDLKPKPAATPTDPNDIPIADENLSIQPRRKVRPALTNPWADLPRSWKGHESLSATRFSGRTDVAKGEIEEEVIDDGGVIWREEGMKDAPFMKPPPNEFMDAAFAFQVRQSTAVTTSDAAHLARPGTAAGEGKKYDSRTGRVLPVPREEIWDGVSLKSPLFDGNAGGAEGWTPPTLDEIDVTSKKGRVKFPKVQIESRRRGDEKEVVGSREERDELRLEEARKGYVRRAFQHAWEGYKAKCYGHDEVAPVSGQCSDHYNGWGATIVDSLDTLLIMNLTHEYNQARTFVASLDFSYLAPSGGQTFSTKLPSLASLSAPLHSGDWVIAEPPNRWRSSPDDQNSPTSIPTFETIIRYLGGLIAAFDLSSDPLMLERAIELGDWILPALSTRYGLPLGHYELGSNPRGGPSGQSILSEVGSMALEFTRLTQLTGDQAYFLAAQRAMDTLDKRFERGLDLSGDAKSKDDGMKMLSRMSRLGTLLPTRISPDSPTIVGGEYTFGALTDSYYEYLIKQHQLVSGQSSQYGRMYEEAIDSARNSELMRPVGVIPGRPELVVLGTINYGRWTPEMQHLTCFAGGMLGLGAKLLDRKQDLVDASGVTDTCVWMYESSETGVGCESVEFYEPDETSRWVTQKDPLSKHKSGEMRSPRGSPAGRKHGSNHYIGRPETIESVFYMFRLTGDRYWQDQGWKMFTSWMEHSITPYGFASIGNNQQLPVYQTDSQESFVLAETLKYYYLLFSPPDLISLDDFVFNTEAHPFYVPRGDALSSYPSPKPLWPGFSSLPTPSAKNFVAGGGEGTAVQRWARVQQASKLSHVKSAGDYMRMKKLEKSLKDQIAEIVQEEEERKVEQSWKPVFVRPTDEELRDAAEEN